MEINEKSRLLFMKYAIPCANTLVKRGTISQEYVDMLMDAVKNGRQLPKDAEKVFKVAFSACTLIAMDNNTEAIDEDVIRDYFLFKHDDVIDRRYEEMGDFDPDACRTRSGVVESVEDGIAVVANSAGRRSYLTDFVPDLKKGDIVVTHWNFIIEKIDKEITEKMKSAKLFSK
jgi:hydrogenase maturation factor